MLKEFRELGLSYYESKALEPLLKEALTAKEVSRKSGIPPGKVYSVLLALERKGLIQSTESRPQRFHVESASAALETLLESRQEQYDRLFSVIREFATATDVSKSKIPRFFDVGTSQEDNRRIQSRTFIESRKEVCQILNVHHRPESNRQNKIFWEKEIVRATQRGVRFRSVYPANSILPKILADLNKKHTESFSVRLLDTTFPRCDVIDKRKVLIKLVHKDAVGFGGILFVENEKLAKNIQEIFERMWEEATVPRL